MAVFSIEADPFVELFNLNCNLDFMLSLADGCNVKSHNDSDKLPLLFNIVCVFVVATPLKRNSTALDGITSLVLQSALIILDGLSII